MIQVLDGSVTIARLQIIQNNCSTFLIYVETIVKKTQKEGDSCPSTSQSKSRVIQALKDRQNEVEALATKLSFMRAFYNKCQTIQGDVGR